MKFVYVYVLIKVHNTHSPEPPLYVYHNVWSKHRLSMVHCFERENYPWFIQKQKPMDGCLAQH